MNPLEIIQAVFGEQYEFNPTELMRLKQVIDLAARNCLQWQPIETAPKEAFQNILLWDGEDVFIGFHSPGDAPIPDRWVQADIFDEVHPTHWIPLPEPPEEE